VAAAAAPSSGWTPSRLLLRTDLSALLPRRQGQGWAIPVFLQLLVYSEVVPLVCQRLGGDGAEVRRALFFGSLVPLAMCIVWTLVAVGLVPPEALAANLDPVDSIIRKGSSWVSLSVLVLALSAITTTVIGTFLSLAQFIEDVLSYVPQVAAKRKGELSKLLSVIPATMISVCGSKTLYYVATSFAGAFPVTLLWGVFPTAASFYYNFKKERHKGWQNRTTQVLLLSVSILMIIYNAFSVFFYL
jgi:tyrosine-specific transport protein